MVIDHLGPGGAERQFVMLAIALKGRNYDVRVVVFQPEYFRAGALRAHGIVIVSLEPRNLVHLVFAMRRELRRESTDVVIAFLKWSSFVVELAGVPGRNYRLIASERSLDTSGSALIRYLRYTVHRNADVVVSNAFAQRDQMLQEAPFLRERVRVIVNGVDLDGFRPQQVSTKTDFDPGSRLRILVLARYAMQKNPFGLLDAVTILRDERPDIKVLVDWYGQVPKLDANRSRRLRAHQRGRVEGHSVYRRLGDAIIRRSLHREFRLHDARRDVVALYNSADVVCLPSFYEGCSNVIAEAMACGRPVLASRISDNTRLITEGENGFLFNPNRPREIADTIMRFVRLPKSSVQAMGEEGRRVAESVLSPVALVDNFDDLISELLTRSPKRPDQRPT